MEKKFIRVDEVARVLEISESHAYKLMRKLNRELEEKGYIKMYPVNRTAWFLKSHVNPFLRTYYIFN